MAINLRNEKALTLYDAAKVLPLTRSGRHLSPACLYNWIHAGVKTPYGLIRLEAIRLGGRWLTSAEAIARFAARQTPDVSPLAKETCSAKPTNLGSPRART